MQSEYTYEPFGKTTASGQASGNAAQYTGRELDASGLYYYRARYYSPSLQRFISEDPIGFGGGVNFYSYVSNDPVSRKDPLGLVDAGNCVIVGAVAGGAVGAIVGGVLGLWGIAGGPAVVVTSGAGAATGAGVGILGGALAGGLICTGINVLADTCDTSAEREDRCWAAYENCLTWANGHRGFEISQKWKLCKYALENCRKGVSTIFPHGEKVQ